MKTVCSECGGDDVSIRMWKNLKIGIAESVSSDKEDNWCEDCQEHVELIDVEN